MDKRVMRTTLLVGLSFWLYACGSTNGGGDSIAWGPPLDASDLSPLHGADDDFGPDVAGALMRAARAVPKGATQSSSVEDGRTADEMSVQVVRDYDGDLVHEVTDSSRIYARVQGPRVDIDLALFTDLMPGIEPDLQDFPHEVLGMWAWEGGAEGPLEVGAFWSASPSIPPVEFGDRSPPGIATYEGDAVGLHAAGGAVTKFLADVEMSADFGSHTVSGEVSGFRSLAGSALGDGLVVNLGETGFSPQGEPFTGETTASGVPEVPGGGRWGARWSDGKGRAMGGTFGFAADDESFGVLGAFTAAQPASASGGNPDDPVASNP